MILTVTLNPCVDHTLFLPSILLHDTNRATVVERDAGGKGVNVSRVIKGLGGDTVATGFLGGGAGAYVRSTLDREEVRHDFVAIDDETRINFSVECGDGTPPTCFNEPGPSVSTSELDQLNAVVAKQLPRTQWLVLGGSRPKGIDPDVFLRLGLLSRKASVPFALDADGEMLRLGLAAGPALVKPNVSEASRLLGRELNATSECLAAAEEIAKMLAEHGNHAIVVISRGAEGAVMFAEGGAWIGTSPRIQCQSTVGSGDSMVAAMLVALSHHKPVEDVLRFGLAAGAATASRVGGGLCTLSDLKALLPEAQVHMATG